MRLPLRRIGRRTSLSKLSCFSCSNFFRKLVHEQKLELVLCSRNLLRADTPRPSVVYFGKQGTQKKARRQRGSSYCRHVCMHSTRFNMLFTLWTRRKNVYVSVVVKVIVLTGRVHSPRPGDPFRTPTRTMQQKVCFGAGGKCYEYPPNPIRTTCLSI